MNAQRWGMGIAGAVVSMGLVFLFTNCSQVGVDSDTVGKLGGDEPPETQVGFFVDASKGSDENIGDKPEAPWKTLSKISSVDFPAGTVIFLKRGGVWDEAFEIKSSGLSLSAYGAGVELPRIDGSLEIGPWDSEGGNLYSQVLVLESGEAFGNLSEDGIMLAFTPWMGNATATFSSAPDGAYSFDDLDKKLYLKCSTTPVGNIYRISRRLYGISATNLSDIQIENIEITRFSLNGINFKNCQNCSVKNVSISKGGGVILAANPAGGESYIYGGNGIEYDTNSSGGLVDQVTIQDIFDSGVSPQTFASQEKITGIRLQNSTIERCGFAGVEVSVLSNGGTVGSLIEKVSISGLVISGSGKGWSGRRYGTEGYGIRIQADAGAGTILGVSIDSSQISGSAGSGIRLSGDVGAVTLNRLKVHDNNLGIEATDPAGISLRLLLTSSLIFNNSTGGIVFNAPQAAGFSLLQNTLFNNPPMNLAVFGQAGLAKIQNNIFAAEAPMTHIYVGSPLAGAVSLDNNCYSEFPNMFGYNSVAYQSVVEFNQALGFETHGLGGLVDFTDSAGGDFSLKSSSTCRGLGSPTAGVLFDYHGKKFSNPPSAGAIEK